MATVTHFPFQTQIHYTALDGSKLLRVITKKLEVSNEREELAKEADAELVQQNCLMQGSKQARAGNTRKAQAIMKVFNRKCKDMAGVAGEQWVSNRADFQAQTSEIYNAMNMQAQSMNMTQPPMMYASQTVQMPQNQYANILNMPGMQMQQPMMQQMQQPMMQQQLSQNMMPQL